MTLRLLHSRGFGDPKPRRSPRITRENVAEHSVALGSLSDAVLLIYTRFLGALNAQAFEWTAAQRAATQLYLERMLSYLRDFQTILDEMMPNILITNEEQVFQIYAFLYTTGLPESEVDTLRAFNI